MTFTGAGSANIPALKMQVGLHMPRTWAETSLAARFWTYRLGAYLLLNVVDDPAWLALVFC